jgi:hypothetical protein
VIPQTRVACFGSVCCQIGNALREHTDLDVQLYIDDRAFALNTAYRDERTMFEADSRPCGGPVITYVNAQVMELLYDWHPLIEADSVEDDAAQTLDLRNDPRRRQRLGELGRVWVEQHHTSPKIAATYAPHIERLARTG